MADSPTSILVTDVGSVATKVGLVDLVAGEYRMIGATRTMSTVDAPYNDLMLGVRQGIMQLRGVDGTASARFQKRTYPTDAARRGRQ